MGVTSPVPNRHRSPGRTAADRVAVRLLATGSAADRLVAAGLVVAGLAALVACGGDPAPDAGPPGGGADARLTATITAAPGALLIEYTLTNRDSQEIIAFTGLPARDTHLDPAPDPDTVYITPRDRDGTVELAKRVFAPPDGVGVAVDYVVRGTRVAPGGQVTERLQVPWPLTGRRPYQRVRLPDPVRRLVFCVGAARSADLPPAPSAGSPSGSPPAPAGSAGTDPGLIHPQRASVARVQRVICAAPVDPPALP